MSIPLQLVLLGLLLTFIAYQPTKEERMIDKMTSEMRILEEREELVMDREKLIQRNKERTQMRLNYSYLIHSWILWERIIANPHMRI